MKKSINPNSNYCSFSEFILVFLFDNINFNKIKWPLPTGKKSENAQQTKKLYITVFDNSQNFNLIQ